MFIEPKVGSNNLSETGHLSKPKRSRSCGSPTRAGRTMECRESPGARFLRHARFAGTRLSLAVTAHGVYPDSFRGTPDGSAERAIFACGAWYRNFSFENLSARPA
jgi:hypothetical protein